MSLNSEQMLPARVRKMRQMEDLLNVEDIILAEIERIIDEMYGAAALLHEELVNEAWLKEKLDARTGADTTVEADADKLLATITLDVSKIVGVDSPFCLSAVRGSDSSGRSFSAVSLTGRYLCRSGIHTQKVRSRPHQPEHRPGKYTFSGCFHPRFPYSGTW